MRHLPKDDYTAIKLLQRSNRRKKHQRRMNAIEDFLAVALHAKDNGFILAKHSESHYELKRPGEWSIMVYPGNRRIYQPQDGPRAPFLAVAGAWTLRDVVDCAIAHHERECEAFLEKECLEQAMADAEVS